MPAQRYPHVNAANKYARDVVAGRIAACKWVKLACQRHLDDLKRKGKGWQYHFDRDEAEKVCEFAELLTHTKGEWARKKERIKLEPWQKFNLCSIFGWRHAKTGRRRFREAYDEIPRKNGKSVLAAVVALYCFCADGEYGAEVYSGATTEKQAWEVFRPAKAMVNRDHNLKEAFGIEVWARNLLIPSDGSRFEPVIGDPGDGSSPSCSVIDEFHEHKSPNLYDTMITGMGAREQPLAFIITTAGDNIAGPCYDKRNEVMKMLEGVVGNDELFGIIYTIDPGDDPFSPKVLAKANPNMGVSVSADFLRSRQRQARQNANQQNIFKTKHLNVWVSSRSAFFNMEHWQRCEDRKLSIDQFEGEPCWFVLDLASKLDVTAFIQLFRKSIDDQDHYYAFGRFYLPENTIGESPANRGTYTKWVNGGHLFATEGDETDFNFIASEVIELGKKFAVEEVVYDPWRATQLAHQVAAEGATVVEYRQTVQTMSPPMKELEAAIKSGRFHHDGHPVLAWMISNVVARRDNKENVYPTKETKDSPQKIDGAVALIMGMGRAMHKEESIDLDLMKQF